jgi:excisionase family DNA binding protein
MGEDPAMTVIPMMTRRLLRTKQAAAYLSMSEWKLRRLIQTEILPFGQDQRGGSFQVDLRDLDAYIEGNKHNIGDAHHWEPNPVLTAVHEASPQQRRGK